MRIKNWENFQHYKSGRGAPPWIKLYRGLLNDKEWHLLDASAAKFLVSVWILAAEYDGMLPDIETIAFRLRCDSKVIAKHIKACSHWIIADSDAMLATCYQSATPETETETYTETEKEIDGFDEFWSIYEKKGNKMQAQKSWKKLKPSIELQLEIYAQARLYVQSTPDKQFRKDASTWLNNHCWNDVVVTKQPKVGFFSTLMNLGDSQNEQLPNPFTPRLDG